MKNQYPICATSLRPEIIAATAEKVQKLRDLANFHRQIHGNPYAASCDAMADALESGKSWKAAHRASCRALIAAK